MKKILEFQSEVAFHSSVAEKLVRLLITDDIKVVGIEGLRKREGGFDLDNERIISMNEEYLKKNPTAIVNSGAIRFIKFCANERDLYMLITTEKKIPESILKQFR